VTNCVPQEVKDEALIKWRNIVKQIEANNIEDAYDLSGDYCSFCDYFIDNLVFRGGCMACPLNIDGESRICHPLWDAISDIFDNSGGGRELYEEDYNRLLEYVNQLIQVIEEVEICQ
jgi:hypothetical protein